MSEPFEENGLTSFWETMLAPSKIVYLVGVACI